MLRSYPRQRCVCRLLVAVPSGGAVAAGWKIWLARLDGRISQCSITKRASARATRWRRAADRCAPRRVLVQSDSRAIVAVVEGRPGSASAGAQTTAPASVSVFGDAVAYGAPAGGGLNAPLAGMALTPGGHGYWLATTGKALPRRRQRRRCWPPVNSRGLRRRSGPARSCSTAGTATPSSAISSGCRGRRALPLPPGSTRTTPATPAALRERSFQRRPASGWTTRCGPAPAWSSEGSVSPTRPRPAATTPRPRRRQPVRADR